MIKKSPTLIIKKYQIMYYFESTTLGLNLACTLLC
jgi:hypothetical protein